MSDNTLTEYELAVLRDIAGDDPERELRWGAAMGEATESLRGRGYIALGTSGHYTMTSLGWAKLREARTRPVPDFWKSSIKK